VKILFTIALLAVTTLQSLPALEAFAWPRIQPLSKQWRVDGAATADETFGVVTDITSENGTPLYRVECHNGNYNGQIPMNFSGDFQCALFAIKDGAVASPNLLAADTPDERSADWWNRGRMRSEQLRGGCLRYPEYSTERHFKLRGMLMTLRFIDVQWQPQIGRSDDRLLEGFTFVLRAVPDKSADSFRAQISHGGQPPRSCYP
jgi:hypothetical protein